MARREKGDWDGAIEDLTEAIRLKPDFADAPGVFPRRRSSLIRSKIITFASTAIPTVRISAAMPETPDPDQALPEDAAEDTASEPTRADDAGAER